MKKTTKILIGAALIAVIALTAGITGMAVADTIYGSRSDPLVTKSYIDSVLTPAIMDEVDRIAGEKAEALLRDVDSKIAAQNEGAETVGEAAVWEKVTLSKNQTLTCQYGTEIILRLGGAQSYGPDAPRLIDETDGTQVTNTGEAIVKNHLYFVSIVNNGITATSDNTVLFIKGSYTVA
ncbi:MAG: hypothetical protein IJ788_06800 [Oscillospiraceae bacterium]|nr:hypothetical protein [Oscillospiraceae bacterium]